MSLNLNFTHKNEYTLHNSISCECIRLYGIEVKLLKTKKLNLDREVFGDWSSIKTNNKDIFDVHIMPDNSENFDFAEFAFGEFGFTNTETCSVYISAQECMKLGFGINELMSCLVVLPSNKVMEITNAEVLTPGINNLWAYSDAKTVFKLALNTYKFKLHDEIEPNDVINTLDIKEKDLDKVQDIQDGYDPLDNYFEKLLNTKEVQDYEAEVKPLAQTVETDINISLDTNNKKIQKPVVNKDEIDPFGW